MQNFKINNVTLPALPGNLRLVPDFNTYGPFLDGRHYSTGTVRTSKNALAGYYANSNGNIAIKI